jgi:tetratricopeptide (TPR) repeat protein
VYVLQRPRSNLSGVEPRNLDRSGAAWVLDDLIVIDGGREDRRQVSAQAGACYLDLGMTVEAEQTLHLALTLLDEQASERTRDRVHYLSRLARTSLLKGDVDEACAHAEEAVLHAETVGSARVMERLGEVAAALRPFGGHQAASEATERISALTGPRSS